MLPVTGHAPVEVLVGARAVARLGMASVDGVPVDVVPVNVAVEVVAADGDDAAFWLASHCGVAS